MVVIDKHMHSVVIGEATPQNPRFSEAYPIVVWPNEDPGDIMDRAIASMRRSIASMAGEYAPLDDYRLAVLSGTYENLLYVTSCMVETVFMP